MLALLAFGVTRAAADVPVIAQDPPVGSLHTGERVLVNDGSCPSGQIKEVTGGGNVSERSGTKKPGIQRIIRCIPRPP